MQDFYFQFLDLDFFKLIFREREREQHRWESTALINWLPTGDGA